MGPSSRLNPGGLSSPYWASQPKVRSTSGVQPLLETQVHHPAGAHASDSGEGLTVLPLEARGALEPVQQRLHLVLLKSRSVQLGPYGGPMGVAVSYERDTPIRLMGHEEGSTNRQVGGQSPLPSDEGPPSKGLRTFT